MVSSKSMARSWTISDCCLAPSTIAVTGVDGHADRCATSIFDRVIDQIEDRPAQRERPGQYRGPPFTGVGHRAAGVGSILADGFDRGIGEYPRLPPRTGGSSRQLLARASFDHCRTLLGDHDRPGVVFVELN